jgi:hypothetical protein
MTIVLNATAERFAVLTLIGREPAVPRCSWGWLSLFGATAELSDARRAVCVQRFTAPCPSWTSALDRLTRAAGAQTDVRKPPSRPGCLRTGAIVKGVVGGPKNALGHDFFNASRNTELG